MLRKIMKVFLVTLLIAGIAYTQESEETRLFGNHFVVNQTLSGLPLHWADGYMEYHISQSVPNRFRDPIHDGFNAWQLRPEISDLIESKFQGLTSSNQWGGPADGINNVVYISRNWNATTGADEDIVALTRIRYNALTGRITDADIAINADHHRFSHAPPPPQNQFSMHNIIAHEVGHVWGLSDLFPHGHPGHHVDMGDDNENKVQTMYGVFERGETVKQEINNGDIAGIKYIYEVLPVLNIDIVLVYDRSENYNETYNALTQAKNRGVELVDQLRIGDRIGVVQFPDEVVLGLTTIAGNSNRSNIQNTIEGIQPGGNVSVGSGILKAQEILEASNSANNLQAIILFSAGEENSVPYVIDVIDDIHFPVYTIGLGGSSGQTVLNALSDGTGGEFFLAEDFSHISDGVSQIWTHLTDRLTIFTGDGMTDDLIGDPFWQEDIIVDGDAEEIQPGIIWVGSDLDLCLITPSGVEICHDDDKFEYVKGPTYAYFNIKNPEQGKWGLKVVVNDAQNQRFFGYMRGVARELIMTAELDRIRYIVGDDITIIVTLVAGGNPLSGNHETFGDPVIDATVKTDVTFPDGTNGERTLHHQGNGLYAATIATNDLAGAYRFNVTASRGEDFTRERLLSTYVATSEDELTLHTAFAILNNMTDYIAGLPVGAFRPASEGRRGAFTNKLQVVESHMQAEEYGQAIDKLESDLLPKFGYNPSSPDNVWIDDEAAQEYLIEQTLRLIGILSDLSGIESFSAKWLPEHSIAESVLPDRFEIFQNYPNPFNPVTTIRYQLPDDMHVNLGIYNVLGQRVRTLVDDIQTAGFYSVAWDGTNQSGMTLSSGMYFYRIQAGQHSDVHKMLFMK